MSCPSVAGCGARLLNTNCQIGDISCRPPSIRPPVTMCCGMPESVCVRLSNYSCCLPMCCPPEAPQCPTPLYPPRPTCGCPMSCGGGCPSSSCGGGPASCCPTASPCSPKVILTKECPKKKCCPIRNKDQCPDRVTWPDPPKIDMCCSTSCPQRRVDICYMKVCPSPARCCPSKLPCAAEMTTMGACCNGRK